MFVFNNRGYYETVSILQRIQAGGGGGGGTPLYKAIYVCVQCHRVWFLIRFGLKRGIDLHHFGLK